VEGSKVEDKIEEGNEENNQAEEPSKPSELDELKDKHLRLLAEFDNFKKRVTKERSDLIKYQGEGIFRDLLEIVDNFERALKFKDAEPDQVRAGIEMIYKELSDLLSRYEVRAESSVGKDFDPNIHMAISRVPADEPGKVIDEHKKAYFYKDKLLRAGEVVVSVEKDDSSD
jgi:molecular chaperone GrpE